MDETSGESEKESSTTPEQQLAWGLGHSSSAEQDMP